MHIDPSTRVKIITALQLGMPLATAADWVEVDVSVIRREMSRDRQFRAQVRKAIADCMHERLTKLEELKNWQALAFILESLWPRRFGRKRRQMPKVIVRRLSSPKLDFNVITRDEKRELDRILAKLHGKQRLLPDRTNLGNDRGRSRAGSV